MLPPWYVTGFSEGEAAFTYSRNGRSLGLYFSIKTNAQERNLITELRAFFGVGRIYEVKARLPGTHSGYTRGGILYRVTKISHLGRIVKHFDRYPLAGKKLAAYNIWKEMYLLKSNIRTYNDFRRLEELAFMLTSVNTKNSVIRRRHKETSLS